MVDERCYSVAQVSDLLGIRRHAVLALIRSGELGAFDISQRGSKRPRWRIAGEDFDAFVARRTKQPKSRRRRRKHPLVKKFF